MRRPTHAVAVVTGALVLAGCALLPAPLLPARPVDGAPFAPVVTAATPSVAKVGGKTCSGADLVGSAFVAADHLLLTAAHVVAGARTVELRFPGREPVAAELVAVDAGDDTAVLRVGGDLPPALALEPALIPVGDPVVVIGYPLAEQAVRTVLGRVSGQDDSAVLEGHPLRDLLVIDAQVATGTSGGPVVDSAGRVRGMASAQISGRGGRDSSQLITLAIPSGRLAQRLAASADLPAPTPC